MGNSPQQTQMEMKAGDLVFFGEKMQPPYLRGLQATVVKVAAEAGWCTVATPDSAAYGTRWRDCHMVVEIKELYRPQTFAEAQAAAEVQG